MDGTVIAVLISAAASACIGILSQVQHSRCTKINLCFGCFSCDRTIDRDADAPAPTPEEQKAVELSTLSHTLDNIGDGLEQPQQFRRGYEEDF